LVILGRHQEAVGAEQLALLADHDMNLVFGADDLVPPSRTLRGDATVVLGDGPGRVSFLCGSADTIWRAFMRVVFRLLVAGAVLVFYLPVISGVALAIVDASGWSPGALTGWWKYAGNMIADGVGLSASVKENMFTIWGLAALLSVIGHTLLSIARVRG
jgi:hypothetical protein